MTFNFIGISHTSPEKVRYQFQLVGVDKNWSPITDKTEATYSGLSQGTYTFKVKTANSSGVWNKQQTILTIQILPPWWAGRWAFFAYILGGLLMVYYFTRYYHKRTEEKNRRKIELIESEKEKEILQAKIEFFTNVAHEIRTPLTLIKGPLEKVIKNTTEVPIIKDSLKIMERNTNRLIDLSNQLLDFRQTEIKGFSLTCIKADIAELLSDTYINFKPLAEQKNIDFELNITTPELFAFVDIEAFNKILTNLFSNAIKYAESKVMVDLLPVEKQDKCFTIEIKNDGYLVPFEMKDKIFEPFFRLPETSKQKGTGIGLALSRSLAQLHKGVLDLKEPQNSMNVFYLTMPVSQEA